MYITKKISWLLFNLIALIFLFCSGIAYSQNLQVANAIDSLNASFSKTNGNKIKYQNPSDNFYRTDSIFSIRSPKGYVPSLLYNIGAQATAPLYFSPKQWVFAGAAIGITVSLMHFDSDIDEWARVQKQKHNWVNKASPVLTEFGGNFGIYTVVATGLISAAFKNQKGVQTSLMATQAMITSGLWVHLIKQISGRERPMASYTNSKSEGGEWYGPFAQYDQDLAIKRPGSSFDSFPSGHTATAFSIATVFASQYKNIKAIPILSYTLATLVGVSRLTEHEHWASDVFAGAVLGYFCGKQVVSNFNKTHPKAIPSTSSKSSNKAELTFIQAGNKIGLSLKW